MDPNSSSNKTDIDENVQRTVQRTALRKIRGAFDALQREDQEDRRLRLRVYAVCAALVLLLIWFVAGLILN